MNDNIFLGIWLIVEDCFGVAMTEQAEPAVIGLVCVFLFVQERFLAEFFGLNPPFFNVQGDDPPGRDCSTCKRHIPTDFL